MEQRSEPDTQNTGTEPKSLDGSDPTSTLRSNWGKPLMEWPFEVFRKKRTDWIITWKENKIRWVIFYYLVGLIVSCLVMFIEEGLFPIPMRYLYKSLIVFILIPFLTILVSIVSQSGRKPPA